MIKWKEEIGHHHLVLIDKEGKKENQWSGITDTQKRAIIPKLEKYSEGDLVLCKVKDASQNTLFCDPVDHMDLKTYHNLYG